MWERFKKAGFFVSFLAIVIFILEFLGVGDFANDVGVRIWQWIKSMF